MILPMVFALQAASAVAPPPSLPALTMRDVALHRRGRLVLDLFYPERAQREGVSGKVLATCKVVERGLLQDCAILSTTPAGQSFDLASAKVLANAKTDLLTRTGEPTAGRSLNVTVRFVSRGYSDFRILFE